MNKLISIIIPTFNSQTHLKNCINSVLSQTYQNFELIIVDDCSSDNTIKIIKNFIKKDSRIKLFKTKKNSGTVSVPRNLGVKKDPMLLCVSYLIPAAIIKLLKLS